MSRTMTMEPAAGTINPHTGHMEMPMNPDDVALYRAIGPDQPDPQQLVKDEHHQESHSDGHEEVKDREVDRLEDHQEEAEDHQEVGDRQQELPMPMPQAPQPGGHHGDKLVGNPPIIFHRRPLQGGAIHHPMATLRRGQYHEYAYA
jgi:hypothetical protein